MNFQVTASSAKQDHDLVKVGGGHTFQNRKRLDAILFMPLTSGCHCGTNIHGASQILKEIKK